MIHINKRLFIDQVVIDELILLSKFRHEA